jgi:hypothetical protein
VDVDITNFGPFLDAPAPDGLSAIVFDDTGEIFDLLFGPGSGVLGFAGPEWGDTTSCTITEGLAFLNGPSFDDLTAAQDVMVHEFGHYSGLAHTVVNGQIFLAGDESGPTPNNTFGSPASVTVIETMYPFYFGPGSGTATLERDDIAGISTLYPAAGFAASTGSISGRILASNGTTRLSGVNVIARNISNPFLDAVSAVSGDYGLSSDQTDPIAGTYRLNGLTAGAQYAVYVDQILAGGFSTPPIILPNVEEFYSGASESSNRSTDDPATFSPVASVAGAPTSGIDVIFNSFLPGDPLPVGDDGNVQLALPFTFSMCGQAFDSVYVNANGNLTFGVPSTDFSESAQELSAGPPRIAGLWDDLDNTAGGIVTFHQTSGSFQVSWTNVPEFQTGGSNTFAITLFKSSGAGSHFKLAVGNLTARDGLAGYSCGGRVSSGFENEIDLSRLTRNEIETGRSDAYEIFTENDNDLANKNLTFEVPGSFRDRFGNNNTVATATRVNLPFNTADSYSDVSPGDVDFYRFHANAGDILALEVVRGAMDSTLGVFDADTGVLLVTNDDGGGGLLSRLLLQANVDLNLAVAVSTFPDFTFNGSGTDFGRYVLSLRKYRGQILDAGDDTSNEVPFPGFSFPYQGSNWPSVFVNSNGNLTFGTGDPDFSESVGELLALSPRIAPLWDDLDATTGLVIAEPRNRALAVHYVSVPEFFSDSPNYFTVHMDASGAFLFDYGATARSDALVGISPGGGAADPGETDLSRFPLLRKRGTTYEQFLAPDPGDLSWRSLFFLLP